MNELYKAVTLLRILAPHFVAGVELESYKAVRAAPILSYMIGWDLKKIDDYCKRKSWTLEVVNWEF